MIEVKMKVRILKQILTERGFYFIRQAKGSHEIWGNDDGVRVTIAGPDGREIKLGTLISMLKSAGIELK
jgi:predicted RNA binding protein YcfA (HicA-like mRNA interferase family)